ncbi:hypothetical protein KCU64_g7063, partial [Aureobasidium melanogenum]
MIFNHCNKDDDIQDTRLNVRLVCKGLEPVIAHMLAQEWSGRLDLQINKRSMEGLAQIRPIFASHLKAIRLCTQRMDKVGKIDCSDATTKDRVKKLRDSILEVGDWSDEYYEHKLFWMKDDIMSHNQNAEEQQEQFMTGGPLKSLLRALQTLMACHNNSVTLGTYDLGERSILFSEMRLRGFGIEARRPYQWLPSQSDQYPTARWKLQALQHRAHRHFLGTTSIVYRVFGATAAPFFNSVFSVPSEPRVSVIQSDGWRLEMVNHCFLPDGDSWSFSSFDKANYGALYDYVRIKEFKSVVLKSIQGPEGFLESDLNLQAKSLERLELSTVFLGETQSDTAMQGASLKFLIYLQSLVSLQILILEKVQDVSDPDVPYHIQKERVAWNGYAEVQAGLNDLIAKVKAHYSQL